MRQESDKTGREMNRLKRIAISLTNRLYADSISLMLKRIGDFRPITVPSPCVSEVLRCCVEMKAEILFLDVNPFYRETSIEQRIETAKIVRCELENCKIAIVCDEIAYPELARDVMRAKQTGQIDAFFYASGTGEYLSAALDAM